MKMDFSTILDQKRDRIIELWINAVFDDQQIEATNELTFKAVRDSLPRVLESLAAMLADSELENFEIIDEASLEHGLIRAEQGFEPAEIAREYRLLRSVVFSELEADLVQAAPKDVLWAIRLIDTVIDEAIARCFDSYTQSRMEELDQLRAQMQLTNQELTRLVRASHDNMSKLTHELKTPLTSIIGYADLFLRQQQQAEIKDSYVHLESIERVLRSGRLLLRLINDTLQLQKSDGQIKLKIGTIEPQELIRSVIEIVEPLARNKGLELRVACDRIPPTVQTDPLRLQQILTNLLSNAIRYTESGYVAIAAETLSDNRWSITVRDSGIGMAQAEQNYIFEPYYRVSSSSTAETDQGTGLGLAIVAQLVNLMQGEIAVSSQPGQGSTFTVILPTHPPAVEPAIVAETTEQESSTSL
ncbi:HAMP domain-containing sensor histidine kinase [Nodosilinea sp. E11]|uniref:sensor histidine kinase n=1 Tax=Nodosilinea sp. E11 TaxID=3037479 RepID=UPI0029341E59|nr:HAMP domain-containing sensor histidine kinase [Nodosilinea sp. E11]WOD41425.1 HAMP domain-containing sensor histidine kinase [Nodosilinea sp. E11]